MTNSFNSCVPGVRVNRKMPSTSPVTPKLSFTCALPFVSCGDRSKSNATACGYPEPTEVGLIHCVHCSVLQANFDKILRFDLPSAKESFPAMPNPQASAEQAQGLEPCLEVPLLRECGPMTGNSQLIHLARKRAFRGSGQAFRTSEREEGVLIYVRFADDVLGWGRELAVRLPACGRAPSRLG